MDTILNKLGDALTGTAKILLCVFAMGWAGYESLIDNVDSKINHAKKEMMTIRNNDLETLRRELDHISKQNDLVLNYLIKKGN